MHSIKNKIGLILIIFIGIFIVPFNTLGKNKTNGQSSSSSTVNSAKAKKACSDDLNTSGLLNVTKENDNFYKLTLGASAGKWDVHYILADADDTDWNDIINDMGYFESDSIYVSHYTGASQEISIPRGDENKALYVIALPYGNGDSKIFKSSSDATSTDLLKSSYTVVVNNKKVTKETTCKTGSVKINKNSDVAISNTGAILKKTIVAKPVTTKKKLSTSAQKQCDAMRNSKEKINDTTDYFTKNKYTGNIKEIKDAYQEQMKLSFNYCYDSNYEYDADYTIKSNDIKEIRQNSLKAFFYYYQAKKNSEDTTEYDTLPKEGYTKIENLDENKFSCKADNFMEQTNRYYYENVTTVPNACKITCRENYEITYSPPQVVKAGLCFNYTVTIKSKVACKTEIDSKFNWPSLKLPSQKQCILSPVCENDANETQAGPNESFDSCISTCDGGKYTQKCINSCYNKVYNKKKKITKTNSNTTKQQVMLLDDTNKNETSSIMRLADKDDDPYENVAGCKTIDDIKKNWDSCGEEFSKLKKEYPLGYYFADTDNEYGWPSWVDLKWHPCFNKNLKKCKYEDDNGNPIKYNDIKHYKETENNGNMDFDELINNIKRSSPYYFATKARATKTLKSFFAVETGKNGLGGKRYYVIDERGIKRQYSSSYKCKEKCGFTLENDTDIADIDCTSSKSGGKIDDYIDKLNKIASDFSQCIASDSCAEDTADFEISIDEKRGKNEKECSTSNTESTSKSGSNNKNKENSCPSDESKYEENFKDRPNLIFMPLDKNDVCYGTNGKCYKKPISGNPYHYKTTITTPGSWVEIKTGAVTYEDKRQDDKYRAKDIQYCTRYDTCDVNEEWAKQVIDATTVNSENHTSTVDGNKVTITDGITENITAKIENFGKYGASFNLSCFYGLTNTPCVGSTCDPGDAKCYINDDGEEVECVDDNGGPIPNGGTSKFKNSYDIRIASNDSIFPQKANGKTRFRGYNWGSQAKLRSNDSTIQNALNITGYGVDPVTYSTEVMKKGQDIYNGDADMTITISKQQMKELKSDDYKITVDGDSYTKVDNIPGLYYYKITDSYIEELITRGDNWILGNNSKTAKGAMN